MTTTPFHLAVCSELVYADLPHLERCRRIHDRGFAVEIWGWQDKDLDGIAATGATVRSMSGYLSGRLADAEGAEELLRTCEASIPAAKTLGSPVMNLHGTGLGPDGLPLRPCEVITGAMWIQAARTLERVAALGERHEVTFVLENLNLEVDHPGTPFGRLADVLTLVQAVDHPNLRINLDLYHVQIGEGNLIEWIERAMPWVGEVQVADVPGRHEPGTGEIAYPAVARALADAGWRGTVAFEGSPQGDSDLALDRFRDAFTL